MSSSVSRHTPSPYLPTQPRPDEEALALTLVTDYYIVTEHTAVTTTYDVTQTTTVTDTVALPAETIFVPNPTPTVTSTNVVTSTKLLGYGACGPHATTL